MAVSLTDEHNRNQRQQQRREEYGKCSGGEAATHGLRDAPDTEIAAFSAGRYLFPEDGRARMNGPY